MAAVVVDPLMLKAFNFATQNLDTVNLGAGATSRAVASRVGDLVFLSGRIAIGSAPDFPGGPFCLSGAPSAPGQLPTDYLPKKPGTDVDENGQTEWNGVGSIVDAAAAGANYRTFVCAWANMSGYTNEFETVVGPPDPVLFFAVGEVNATLGGASVGYINPESHTMTPFGVVGDLLLHEGAVITFNICYLAADADPVSWPPTP